MLLFLEFLPQISRKIRMNAQDGNTVLLVECKVVTTKKRLFCERQISQLCVFCRVVQRIGSHRNADRTDRSRVQTSCLRRADSRSAKCFRAANIRFRKHGNSPITTKNLTRSRERVEICDLATSTLRTTKTG